MQWTPQPLILQQFPATFWQLAQWSANGRSMTYQALLHPTASQEKYLS